MAYIPKLSYLSDVSITSPADKDLLQYNNGTGKWENKTVAVALGLYALTVDNSALTLDSGTTYNPTTAARTISHATGPGYKHLPSNITATKWLQGTTTDGLGAWITPATLTTAAGKGLLIGSLTTGTYDINTTKSIEVDFTQVQAILTNPVTGTGAQYQIAIWTGTHAIEGNANFTVDGSYNVTIAQNLTVAGNLTVSGMTTTLNVDTLSVEDQNIKLANGNTVSDAVDFGVYGTYKATQQKYSGLFRDASDGVWKFYKDLQDEPSTTVNESGTGYAYATVKMYNVILSAVGSGSDTNYLVYNTTTGVVSYRSLPSSGSMSSFYVASTDVDSGGKDIADGQYLCIIPGSSGHISSVTADGVTGHVKITIDHVDTPGHKHLPSGSTSTTWLQNSGTDGVGSWGTPATLTTNGAGILIGASNTGFYDINTTKAIAVEFGTSHTTVAYGDHTHTGLISGLTAGRVVVAGSATTLTDDGAFLYDTTAHTHYMNCGQRWRITAVTDTYTLLANDMVVTMTAAIGKTITIPTALFTSNVGQVWAIKQMGAGAVTLDPEGTQTIDGAATYVTTGQYVTIFIQITSTTTAIVL